MAGLENLESIEGLDSSCLWSRNPAVQRAGAHSPYLIYILRYKKTFTLNYCEGDILIIEGIHALNPAIYEVVKHKHCCRLYISTHSNFVSGGEILLPARNLRLVRRLLRDYKHRGASLNATLNFWKYIKMGEELYIYPFRQYADFHIDTAHRYEPFCTAARLKP